jgi:hydroxymethylpyrimidine/phosphomethylpyrimidine kinase
MVPPLAAMQVAYRAQQGHGSGGVVTGETRRIALTIAGSDSGGGAGIQADLKTFAAWGCFGTSAITAVTAQNTLGVGAVHPVPAEVVRQQLQALAEDLPPDALKTGMLCQAGIVLAVAEFLEHQGWGPYVLDPVIAATSGDPLLDEAGIAAVRERLVPLALCVTPNLDEAELLTGATVRDPDAMERAGSQLLEMGAQSALIKGGHLASDIVVDVLVTRDHVERFTRLRLPGRPRHGTGCTLSAAITAALALGHELPAAVTGAIEYLQRAIKAGPAIGSGARLLWHDVRRDSTDERR